MALSLSLVSLAARGAAFQLSGKTCYFAERPYQVWLNGQACGAFRENVFSLFRLLPDTHYTLRLETEDKQACQLTFTTPPETAALDISRFGAVGDGRTDCTAAIQTALLCCPAGGCVYVPTGRWLSYPLFLPQGVTLYLEKDAVLQGGAQREKYPVLPGLLPNGGGEINLGTWEGEPVDCYASLLTAVGAEDVTVMGEGIVDGGGSNGDWWTDAKRRRGAWRPRTLFFNHCKNVRVWGITVRNSPSWTIHPYYCTNVRLLSLTIQNPPDSPNTDGCDIESCRDVLVCGVRISVGDDCIVIKSGKYYMGRAHYRPSEHITVVNCLLEQGHGAVVVGSELASGVRGLHVRQCLMRQTERGLRLKTRRGRGQRCRMEDILFENVKMDGVATPFVINMFYNCDADGHSAYVQSRTAMALDDMTPHVGGFLAREVTCRNCRIAGGFFYGLPEQPIERICLENVSFFFVPDAQPGTPALLDGVLPMAGRGIFAANARELVLERVTFSGHTGPAVHTEHVERLVGTAEEMAP